LATQIGVDGYRLLQAVTHPQAPAWLRQIPAVDILRQVWVQQYTHSEHGPEVIWRDADTHGLSPGENHADLPIRHRRAVRRETRAWLVRLQGPHQRDLRQHL
jgi:hypothetical protein